MPDQRSVPSLALERPRLLSWPARHAYSVLAILCLMLWLPGILGLPALDRDESRIAQSARQMIQTGDLAQVHFDTKAVRGEPLGIYWAEAAASTVTGYFANSAKPDHGAIWSYRLPSLLGGIAAVWLTVWAGSLFGAEAGFLAGLLMGLSVLTTAAASIATPDALFLAAILGAEAALMRIYCEGMAGQRALLRTALLGWAALAVAILVEGVTAIGIVGATLVALLVWDWWEHRPGKVGTDLPSGRVPQNETSRVHWLRQTRPLPGAALLLLILAPWVVAATRQGRGMSVLAELAAGAFAGLTGANGHGAPPGYYFLTASLGFWPAILFLLPALGFALTRVRDPAIRFLIAWAGANWTMMAIIPGKLPGSILPVYPALAILVAVWLLAPSPGVFRFHRLLASVSALQFLIGLTVLAAAPILLSRLYGESQGPIFTVIVVAMLGLSALAMSLIGARLMALPLALLAFVIVVPVLTVTVAPALNRLWTSRTLAAMVAKDSRKGDPLPALAGFRQPSLIFALNDKVHLTDGRGAAAWGSYLGGLALVADSQRPAFLERLHALYSDAVPLGRVEGYDYSRGRAVDVTVYRVRALVFAIPPPEE